MTSVGTTQKNYRHSSLSTCNGSDAFVCARDQNVLGVVHSM